MKTARISAFALGAALYGGLALLPAFGGDLENGAFVEGKKGWRGDLTIVHTKVDNSVVDTPGPDTKPAAKLELSKSQFSEISQRIDGPDKGGVLTVEISYRGTPDFKVMEDSPKFTRGTPVNEHGVWYPKEMVYPKADICVRLDTKTIHAYKLGKVTPGGDWETLKFTWDQIPARSDATLVILAPPGQGALLIQSIKVGR